MTGESVVERLTSLRQAPGKGRRAPHKPLLVLLALGQLTTTGSSELAWSEVEQRLGSLLDTYGTSKTTSAAYPFTRLRNDNVWTLSRDVPNDEISPLRAEPVVGRFTPDIEAALLAHPESINEVARAIIEDQFSLTYAAELLIEAGLDPDSVFGSPAVQSRVRKRDAAWRHRVLAAWDRSCAFCGYDGAINGAPVGIEAAHVRWFTKDGPDDLDNGLALCSLHHKLLDTGVLGLRDPGTVVVSARFSSVGDTGRAVYSLHERELRPRPGTPLPAETHVQWHRDEVFKGEPLTA